MKKHVTLALRRLSRKIKRATRATLRFLGGPPGGFELKILQLLKAPPWEETIANNITMLRTRIGFWGIHGLYWPYTLLPGFDWTIWGVFVALVIAASLDFVDGPVARKLKCETKFGRFIDPFSDKTIAWSAFTVLLHQYKAPWWLVATTASIVLYDIVVTRIRMYDKEMRTNMVAKIKQWPLDAGVGVLLFGMLLDRNPHWLDTENVWVRSYVVMLGEHLLWAATILAAVSACIYRRRQIAYAYWRAVPTIQRIAGIFS